MVTKDNCAKIAAVSFVTGVAVGWLLNRYARLVRAGTCFLLCYQHCTHCFTCLLTNLCLLSSNWSECISD